MLKYKIRFVFKARMVRHLITTHTNKCKLLYLGGYWEAINGLVRQMVHR